MKLNEITSGQKVWAVYHSEPYEGSDLYGIFSTEAKAKVAIKSLINENSGKNHYEIQEIEINKIHNPYDLLN